jgi:hypothetical protein
LLLEFDLLGVAVPQFHSLEAFDVQPDLIDTRVVQYSTILGVVSGDYVGIVYLPITSVANYWIMDVSQLVSASTADGSEQLNQLIASSEHNCGLVRYPSYPAKKTRYNYLVLACIITSVLAIEVNKSSEGLLLWKFSLNLPDRPNHAPETQNLRPMVLEYTSVKSTLIGNNSIT